MVSPLPCIWKMDKIHQNKIPQKGGERLKTVSRKGEREEERVVIYLREAAAQSSINVVLPSLSWTTNKR